MQNHHMVDAKYDVEAESIACGLHGLIIVVTAARLGPELFRPITCVAGTQPKIAFKKPAGQACATDDMPVQYRLCLITVM